MPPSSHNLVAGAVEHLTVHRPETEEFKDNGVVAPDKDGENSRLSGAVQGYGVLIVLEDTTGEGVLSVLAVSENSGKIIGMAPEDLFALPNFLDMLSEHQAEELADRIGLLKDYEADVTTDEPEVFPLRLVISARQSVAFWCALHLDPVKGDLIICELEIDDDCFHPLLQTPRFAFKTTENLGGDMTTPGSLKKLSPEDKRLPKAYKNGRRGTGRAVTTRMLDYMSRAQEQLAGASDITASLNSLVDIVKEITGFPRITVHRFDGDFNGRMVMELVDPSLKQHDLGSNLPVFGLLKEAKQGHKVNKVQAVYDRGLRNAQLVYRNTEAARSSLDLNRTYLRAVSPMHIAYTNKVVIRSSMSISITTSNKVWGLILCQSYGANKVRTSFPTRKICQYIGRIASRSIETLLQKSQLQAYDDIIRTLIQPNFENYPDDLPQRLLRLFQADFGLLSVGQHTKILGHPDRAQEGLYVLEHIKQIKPHAVIASVNARPGFPHLKYFTGVQSITGMLIVPMANRPGDMFLFFRQPKPQDTEYQSNPGVARSAYLNRECDSWTEKEIEAATALRSLSPNLIWAWDEGPGPKISRLKRLLLENSAHEVRTPLNAIVNYAELALESPLDSQSRDHLLQIYGASASLIREVNDLTNLFMAL